jgi:hypothetical protein
MRFSAFYRFPCGLLFFGFMICGHEKVNSATHDRARTSVHSHTNFVRFIWLVSTSAAEITLPEKKMFGFRCFDKHQQ